MKVYAKPGDDEQIIRRRNPSNEYVRMDSLRPTGNFICQDNGDSTGQWVPDVDSDDEDARQEELELEKEASGLKQVTVTQARNWIDQQLDAASTVAQTREAIRKILHKMVVHILD